MDALVQGMLMGQNPREVARELRRALGVALSRALTIARTETLRAHREATRASYQANDDLVSGWTWHSAADERTCGSCWAMHGTEHTLEEKLDDHPNGRCAMVPIIRGVAFEVRAGRDLFAELASNTQIKILGPAKWAAWKDGKVTLDEHPLTGIVGRRHDPVWGSMRYERSLREILGREAAKSYTRLALMGLAKEQLSADDLIKAAGLGTRALTPNELERIVQHVAAAGFDPNALERAGGRLAGTTWNGVVLKGNSMIPPGVAHYLRHVIVQEEWPKGTLIDDYYQSLKSIIQDGRSKILISKLNDEWQIGFLGSSLPGTKYNYIWIDYRVSRGHWITGLQLEDLDEFLKESKKANLKWLR